MTDATRETELLRQALLLLPVLIDLVVRVAMGDVRGGWYLQGLALLLLATVAAAVAGRRPGRWVAVLPWVDLTAVGVMRLVPDGNGLGLLAVLPVMWLAADLRMRGAALGFLGTLLLVSLPSLAYHGVDPASLSRALVIPVVAGMGALTVAGAGEVWARQNRRLEEQGRRLQEALDEAGRTTALNEAIIATVDVGIAAMDGDGRFQLVNPHAEEYFALAHPTGHPGVAGRPGEVFGPDRVTRLRRDELPSVRAAAGEQFHDMLTWVGADPHRQRALAVSAGPVIDRSGAFRGSVLSFNDVTDLMAALRVKDEFVASVSHELRTPLTSILGFLEIVLDDDDVTPAVREQLEVVRRNSERLLGLVGDLLVTAQAAEGRIPLSRQATDVSALVAQAVTELAPRAADKGVTVQCDVVPHAVLVVDPLRMRQVVDNLVSNAVKYTPSGGRVDVTVDVAAGRIGRGGSLGPGGEVVLTVRDTGIGISAADREQVFTRFFRSSDAQDLAIQGIGLGLAICKSIVDAHGGTIDLESEVGRGSIFRVRLPGPVRPLAVLTPSPSAASSAPNPA